STVGSSLDLPASPVFSTLSLHDALPILDEHVLGGIPRLLAGLQDHRVAVLELGDTELDPIGRLVVLAEAELHPVRDGREPGRQQDRKSTRLNSSHVKISYAVFCLKKKKK